MDSTIMRTQTAELLQYLPKEELTVISSHFDAVL